MLKTIAVLLGFLSAYSAFAGTRDQLSRILTVQLMNSIGAKIAIESALAQPEKTALLARILNKDLARVDQLSSEMIRRDLLTKLSVSQNPHDSEDIARALGIITPDYSLTTTPFNVRSSVSVPSGVFPRHILAEQKSIRSRPHRVEKIEVYLPSDPYESPALVYSHEVQTRKRSIVFGALIDWKIQKIEAHTTLRNDRVSLYEMTLKFKNPTLSSTELLDFEPRILDSDADVTLYFSKDPRRAPESILSVDETLNYGLSHKVWLIPVWGSTEPVTIRFSEAQVLE